MFQCNRCLAPLQVYQGRPVKVCDRCGAIQADVARPQVIAAPARGKSPVAIIVLAGVILLALVGGLVGVVMMRRGRIADGGSSGTWGGAVTSPGGGQGETGVAYWDDAQRIIKDRVLRELGPGAGVTEVLIYREYAFVEVQGDGERVKYELRDGGFKRSDTGVSPPRSPRDRDQDPRVKLADVDFQRVPAIVKEAQARVGGRADDHVHVRLARHLPFIADPLWSVYIGGGNAEFDLSGKLVGGRTAQGVELEKQIVNYFADASSVRTELVKRFGPDVQLTELVLYPTYSIMEVRDPKQPENVDRYTLRPGGMSPGDPMRNSRQGWDATAFRLDSVNLALVPRLAGEAKSKLRGDVTHIILEKKGIRVYVSDSRNSGYVSFHPDGRLIRVMD